MNSDDGITKTKEESFPCNECQAGVMHLQYITYFTWLNEELVTVPNFPAWVCDVCGRREYDSRAIAWLTTILNPETGKLSPKKPRIHPPVEKRDGTRPSPE
jgi:YgiT-type zinc finger domain-containing protein